MNRIIITLLFLFFIIISGAQEKMEYFLPEDVSYNNSIPTPEDFLNQELGEWHLTHDQVLYYAKEIARLSDRAILYEYARSWENKPLIHLVFTSSKNQLKLNELKKLHSGYSEPGNNISEKETPLVVSLNYGIHGNESSATNSSVLTMYYLAAAEGDKIDQLLDSTIILVDPCLNPDGFTRHSTWANMHQSFAVNGDNNSRQYDEVWPGGRTNHYWFDLNRDYLFLVHPESRGRVAKFHEWKPNIVTDHHEMGPNATFFFQPGVPSRNNPLTPNENYKLTKEIASYHVSALDKIGSRYFSEEQFDDYYYGKGSSYPDLNASIGILFEQAGYRGRIRKTVNGTKKLSFAIKNQFTVTLSTLEAATKMRSKLLGLQKNFYIDALKQASKSKTKGYIFGDEKDKVKTQLFIQLLNQHKIEVFQVKNDNTINEKQFKAENSFIVPAEQKQFKLLTTIFEEVHDFSDTTFYDVSTWTFPHAYNLNYEKLTNLNGISMSENPVAAEMPIGKLFKTDDVVAYIFDWSEFSAGSALYKIQAAGLLTKVATNKLTLEINNTPQSFGFGSILIPVQDQKQNKEYIKKFLGKVANETGIDIYGVSSSSATDGINLGSNEIMALKKPEILVFAGGTADSRDVGEMWHLFDQNYGIPVTIANTGNLEKMNLNKYNTIILAGRFSEWGKKAVNKLKSWTDNGGTLIAYKDANSWISKNNIGKRKFVDPVKPDTSRYLSYIERKKEPTLNRISGAIFEAELDYTHPLCYGYSTKKLAIFKTTNMVAQPLGIKYAEPVKFSSSPYLSGWVSEANINRLKDAPVVAVQKVGKGKLINFYDNMNFRGTWLGTSKLFTNAVFFSDIIR